MSAEGGDSHLLAETSVDGFTILKGTQSIHTNASEARSRRAIRAGSEELSRAAEDDLRASYWHEGWSGGAEFPMILRGAFGEHGPVEDAFLRQRRGRALKSVRCVIFSLESLLVLSKNVVST